MHVSYRLRCFLLISSVPQPSPLSLLLTSILVMASFWSSQLLVFCSTIVVSSCSNSNELVTVVAVVNC
ncbi:unnamed protein product [Hymenolepis diminuta]|uniref:Uncharacterized protein n=1 Tax=Hymenolepis diminuta TaxID=6216 RepID=A0A564Z721_HYMDI|nr:unnamed protein product [Hymenolepis diminuta]